MSLAPYVMGSFQPEIVKLCFRFQVNGAASDPDAQLPAGSVDSVTCGTAGIFVITLPQHHRYLTFLGGGGYVMGDGGVSLGLQVQCAVSDYVASTGVITIRTVDPYTDASPVAVDPTDDDWVYVELSFIRRNILAGSGTV